LLVCYLFFHNFIGYEKGNKMEYKDIKTLIYQMALSGYRAGKGSHRLTHKDLLKINKIATENILELERRGYVV